jgi:hypothetical protein
MNTIIGDPGAFGTQGGPQGSSGGPGGYGVIGTDPTGDPGTPSPLAAGLDPVTGRPVNPYQTLPGTPFGSQQPGQQGAGLPIAGVGSGGGGAAGDATDAFAGARVSGSPLKSAGLLSDGLGGLDWKTLVSAALAVYGIHENQKPPKFYNVPPTPAEQWRTNASQQLFNFASGFTDQYLQGLGNLNPSFTMPNSLTGNPAFMGGVKVPTIDFSKVPTPTPTPPMSPPPTKP